MAFRILRIIVFGILPAVLLASLPAGAQEAAAPIQDNSFLIEEAYNQEAGVVQHINAFARDDDSGDWVYTFTQEWPLSGQRHQLSYTIPWLRFEDSRDGGSGVGDIAVNYRLQLVGNGETPVAFSPRLSLSLPTADEENGRGAGAAGLQANMPLSVVLGERFVTHVNLGAAYTPKAKSSTGDEADVTSYLFGQSFIWLARPKMNFMLELVYLSGEEVIGPGATEQSDSFFVSPGLRWAWDLPSGLQIVPGIAVPLGAGPSSGERQIFLYLSFEHAFRRSGG
jgi:outer membrane putative beta-barrel porin/alpha-amylase